VTPSLPGARLHTLLLRWAPAPVVRDVLEPAIADLQYEAEHASTVCERRQVILRGYFAIFRALALSIEPGGTIRAALALSALCAAGTLLVSTALAAHVDGRVLNSALLVPGMLAPVILRMLGTTSSRRLFVGSLLVAMLTPAFAGGLGRDGERSVWMSVERALALLVVFAPMAAAAAIVAGPNRETPPKRTVTAVSLGSGIATAAFLVARWLHGQQLSIGLAMTPFYVALFAALFGLTLLPLLLVARAFIARPALLAIAGLICSPVPLIAAAYVDHGTLTACLDALRRTPLAFAASSLPFVTGAIAVGWRLPTGGQPPDSSVFGS
jgi:hypothetical protein